MKKARDRRWLPLALGMAAVLLAGGLAAAAGAGGTGGFNGAVGKAGKAVAAQSLREPAKNGAGPAEVADAAECDGDCSQCENQECVNNQGEEQQLNNNFQNCEGECDGDCARSSSRLRERSSDGTCEGSCPGGASGR